MKPLIRATACYLFYDNKLLIMVRDKNKKGDPVNTHASVPGGKIEESETPLENIIREFKDETGITLKQPVLRGEATFINPDHDKDFHVYIYIAMEYKGTLKTDHKEGTTKWVPKENWQQLNWRPGDHKYLPYLFGNKYFVVSITQTKKEVLDYKIAFK